MKQMTLTPLTPREDLLLWMGKGPGKGNNKGKGNNWKGGFQGTCHYCGVYGHGINECRKKDADMKGKGKGQDVAWFPPSPNKGKGKGQKGFWKGGKGKGGVFCRRRLECRLQWVLLRRSLAAWLPHRRSRG